MEDPPLGFAGQPGADGAGDPVGRSGRGQFAAGVVPCDPRAAPRLQASGITVEVLSGMLAAAPTASGTTFGELLAPRRDHLDGGSMFDASTPACSTRY